MGNTLAWEKGRQLKQYGENTYKYNNEGNGRVLMRFFINAKLIFILCIISFVAIGILLVDFLIALRRKTSYISNIIWARDRFLVWFISICLFAFFPIWLSLMLWFVAFFLLKYILLKKDIAYVYHLVNDQSQNDMICRSFGECIEKLFSKTTDYTLQKSILKNEFSFCEYANTLVVVPVYYLFGIVKLYPEYRIGYVVGIYLIAFSIFVLISKFTYSILNQKGNFFEKGLYSYLFVIVLGIVYFVLLTLIINNLGLFTLL